MDKTQEAFVESLRDLRAFAKREGHQKRTDFFNRIDWLIEKETYKLKTGQLYLML